MDKRNAIEAEATEGTNAIEAEATERANVIERNKNNLIKN